MSSEDVLRYHSQARSGICLLVWGFKNLRIHRRLWRILKASNKRVWSNNFWYVKVYIFWNFIQYTNWDKIFRWNTNVLFFFCEIQLITVLLLIHNSCTSWSIKFISLKMCVGFSIFSSVLFLWKFIFLLHKKHGVPDFKMS